MSDEYDPEVTQQMILLMLMRLYDVNMHLLSELNDERAEHIQKIHESGHVTTDMPWMGEP